MQNALRSFRVGTWLGWQVNSNWADPFLFLIYSIARPLATGLILVVMIKIVGQGQVSGPLFDFMYIGNMFYVCVIAILSGVSWSVREDREHYHMLKYLLITPLTYYYYLLGQGMARFLISVISVIVLLVIGLLFLGLRLDPAQIDLPLFLITMVLGILGMSALGVLLATYELSATRMQWQIGETVGTAMFLFTGAIFPITVLPGVFQVLTLALPITYWLALLRRSLLGAEALAFPPFAGWSNLELLGELVLITTGVVLLSLVVYRWGMRRMITVGNVDLDSTH
jgi:ABC-2 type transport system permease protein